jgi:hypothetical protein
VQPGFVIMQIGNAQLDGLYERAVAPALSACGFAPRRVDRHNRGGLLVSEIINFIEEAEVVVADLTHERPNCYLEVGYVLGAGAPPDPDRPRHHAGATSFAREGTACTDLAGFDILFWQPDRLRTSAAS